MTAPLVLCYHAVSERWPSELAVTQEQLETQVGTLLGRGYEATTFRAAATAPPGRKTLAITFDDAYRSVVDRARPVLDALGVVAAVYAPTDWVGRDAPMAWPGVADWVGSEHERELYPLDWDGLRALADTGWEVGSHSCSHPRLTTLGDRELADELERSRETCAEALGARCETIAYPYGDVDGRVVAAAAAAGYTAGAALPARPHRPSALRWPRVGIYRWDSRRRFALKVSPTARRLRRLAPAGALGPVRRATRSATP